MNRRGFIGRIIGAAGAMVAGKAVASDEPAIKDGFGLAPVKKEGSDFDYDITPGAWSHKKVSQSFIVSKELAEEMKAFGLDPNNQEHIEAYLESKIFL